MLIAGMMAALFLIGEITVRVLSLALPGVAYLATAGKVKKPKTYTSIEEFSESHPHLIPYRNWYNYYTNAFGFNDQEFIEPKPSGRFRILALGDSFCFSLVAYPDNVLTLVENMLANSRRDPDIDLLNFGVGASGLYEYRQLLELGAERFDPDLIIVHIYMGNDGPDLYSGDSEIPSFEIPWFSYLGNFLKNALKTITQVNQPITIERVFTPADADSKGGDLVDRAGPLYSEQTERFLGPTFKEDAFAHIMGDELGRLYVGNSKEEIESAWAPVFEQLLRMNELAQKRKIPIVVMAFPSALQIYPEMRRRYIAAIADLEDYSHFDASKVDPTLPNKMLVRFCEKHSIPFFDLTDAIAQAASRREESLYILRDTHWNPIGNRIAAEAEAAMLLPFLPTPLSPN